MPEEFREFELTVGDVLHIGDQVMTVVDIDGFDVSIRIDTHESDDNLFGLPNGSSPRGK